MPSTFTPDFKRINDKYTLFIYLISQLLPALQNQVVFQLTNLRTAFDAHFLILYHTELLTSQSHTTSGTCEAISVIKFFTISYKFDASFYQLLASCTPLCKIIAVAILTNIISLMLGKWLSCQWLCAHCTSEAFWVVHIAIMLYWSSFYRLITPDTDLQNKFQHVINQFVTPVNFFFFGMKYDVKIIDIFSGCSSQANTTLNLSFLSAM